MSTAPEASPSKPSVRFTALVVPQKESRMRRNVAHGGKAASGIVREEKGTRNSIGGMRGTKANRRAAATPPRRSFWAGVRPRDARRRWERRSSRRPMAAASHAAARAKPLRGLNGVPPSHAARRPRVSKLNGTIPAMVGVPALAAWACGPSGRMYWPARLRRAKA